MSTIPKLKIGAHVTSIYLPEGTTATVELLNHRWVWIRSDDSGKVMRVERALVTVVSRQEQPC